MNRAEAFPGRLAAARAMVAVGGAPHPTPGLSDQVDAATAHAARLAGDDAAATGMEFLPPSEALRLEVTARAVAAVTDLPVCDHLRRGPRPATALLGLAVIACQACCKRLRHFASFSGVELDWCGWCAAPGVVLVGEFGVNVGPLMVTGAACAACAAALSGVDVGAL